MRGINKVTLIGNLGAKPEIRNLNDGRKMTFSVATTDSWKNKQTGERRERTEWHRVVSFNQSLVGIAEQYLDKGSKVYIEGSLRTRKWTDKNGTERYTTEVVLEPYSGVMTMLDSQSRTKDGAQADAGDQHPSSPPPASQAPADLNDEIPF